MLRTLTLLALLVAATTACAVAAPQIAVDLATYNFSPTVKGMAVVHVFVLTNTGNQELVIEDVHPGCSCTTARLDKYRLQPGESTNLVAVVETEELSVGRTAKTITITSNDPGPHNDHQLILALIGEVADRQPYQASMTTLYNHAYILLDVRDPTSYAAGHLIGAMNVPASQAGTLSAALPAGALVIFYDQNGASTTMTAVTQALHGAGVADVRALRGGLAAWQLTFGASRMTVGSDPSWGSFLDIAGARAYSSSSVVQNYDVTQLQSAYVLIDIRSASAFAGGHLAGSVNLPQEGITAFVDALPRATEVYVYSADGAQSDAAVSALWMRGSRAKSLLGGIAEWQKVYGDYLIVASSG